MADLGNEEDDRVTPIGLFNYARSYWQSGEHLHSAKLRLTHPDAPVTFLLSHACELYLKAFLRLQGFTVHQLRSIGHKISDLADEAVKRGLSLPEENKEVLRLSDGSSPLEAQ